MIIHQVRNPLATINLCLDHFARRDLDERARRRLTLAQAESERLAHLLDEVLEYAGRQTLEPADWVIDALLDDMLPALDANPVVAERDLRVHLELPEVVIRADRDKLVQAVTNMVINACEAVAPGAPVTLASHRLDGAPCIEVRNGGEPIPPEVLARIGQPFFSTKGRGNGLGVAYIRRIAAAHHWEFTLTSTAEEGTVARLLM